MSIQTKRKTSVKRTTCLPTEHRFEPLDLTPRAEYMSAVGTIGGGRIAQTQKPDFRLYCSKCGEIRKVE